MLIAYSHIYAKSFLHFTQKLIQDKQNYQEIASFNAQIAEKSTHSKLLKKLSNLTCYFKTQGHKKFCCK